MVWLQGAGDDLEQAVLAVAGKPAWGHAGPFLCVYPFVDHGLRGRCLIASLLLGPYTSLGTDWLPLCAAPALGGAFQGQPNRGSRLPVCLGHFAQHDLRGNLGAWLLGWVVASWSHGWHACSTGSVDATALCRHGSAPAWLVACG